MRTGLTLLMAIAALALAGACSQSETTDKTRSGNQSEAGSEITLFDPEYTEYGRVLDSFVISESVDYGALQNNRAHLDNFIDQLSVVSRQDYDGWTEDARLAFWLNAYNGITLRSVIDAYPVESIREIKGVWDQKTWPVAMREVTLDQVEHEIIRTEFRDPRIHFAVNCASRGCPPLADSAFTGQNLEQQLDAVVRSFANHPKRTVIDSESGTVRVSPIFDWFADDFKGFIQPEERFGNPSSKKAAALAFLYSYFSDDRRTVIDSRDRWQVEFMEYDWDLNEPPN